MARRTYIANVLGEGLDLIPDEIPVESYKAEGHRELPVGDDGVRVLYGDPDGVTCVVDADDENDAERRIIATWSDAVTIDDLDLSTLQHAAADPDERGCSCEWADDGTGESGPRPHISEPDVECPQHGRTADPEMWAEADRIDAALSAAEGRTVLVHLNVTVPPADTRSADEIAQAILGALEVGSDDDSVRDLTVEATLSEAI